MQVERYLQEVRPDISFYFEGSYVAIELQISPLPLDELIRRTKAYAQKNISVLWTTSLSLDLYEQRYVPKDLERNLHALYDGVVYYWDKGLDLLPVEFEAYMLSSGWYSSSWKEKPSKRFVTPHILPQVSILELSRSANQDAILSQPLDSGDCHTMNRRNHCETTPVSPLTSSPSACKRARKRVVWLSRGAREVQARVRERFSRAQRIRIQLS